MYKSVCGRLDEHMISYQWGALSSPCLDLLLSFSLDSCKGPDFYRSQYVASSRLGPYCVDLRFNQLFFHKL